METEVQDEDQTLTKGNARYGLHQTPHRKQHKLTETDAEEWVKSAVADLLFWRTPVLSGLWFSTIFLVFFLTLVSEYSLLSLICYVVILQLIFAWVFIRVAPTLSQMGLLRQGFDGRTFVLQRQVFTVDELRNASHGTAVILHGVSLYWYDALTTNDARKVLFVTIFLFGIAIIGKFFTLSMTLFGIFILAFTLPPIYDLRRDQFDIIFDKLQRVTEPIIDAVAARIASMLPENDY